MELYRIDRLQHLPVAVAEAWAFFSSPRNLPDITPPSLRFIIRSDLPEQMYPGMLITYSVTPFCSVPWKWVTEITHVVEPYLFVDRQMFGPYLFWHHEHHFAEDGTGTRMRDLVTYALPYGYAGRMVQGFVRRRLEEIFDYRQRRIEAIFTRQVS